MTHPKLPILLIVLLLIPSSLLAQAFSKVGVVDFERAVVESIEGKKSSEKFKAKLEERQKDVEKRQRELEEAQNKLRTQERVLSDAAKLELQRDIDRRQTELTRVNEDAQKELGALRDELLRPVADIAGKILNAYAADQGYTMVIDVSNPQNNVLFVNPIADITTELIRRIDAEIAKQQAPKGK
jgi:outer membrane protein